MPQMSPVMWIVFPFVMIGFLVMVLVFFWVWSQIFSGLSV